MFPVKTDCHSDSTWCPELFVGFPGRFTLKSGHLEKPPHVPCYECVYEVLLQGLLLVFGGVLMICQVFGGVFGVHFQ